MNFQNYSIQPGQYFSDDFLKVISQLHNEDKEAQELVQRVVTSALLYLAALLSDAIETDTFIITHDGKGGMSLSTLDDYANLRFDTEVAGHA